jgi:hypothetical protein
MLVTTRPSYKELDKRLKEAKECLDGGSVLFANPSKAVGELYELDIADTDELPPLLRELLGEISPDDYVGSKPPQKSYEKSIEGLELLAFSWWSKKLSQQMYIKFVLKNGRYYYVSLHPDRSSKHEGKSV